MLKVVELVNECELKTRQAEEDGIEAYIAFRYGVVQRIPQWAIQEGNLSYEELLGESEKCLRKELLHVMTGDIIAQLNVLSKVLAGASLTEETRSFVLSRVNRLIEELEGK